MARRDAFLDAGRAGRERQRRLRDEVLRVGLELGAEGRHRGLVGFRPDHHAVAAGAVHLLDHQLLEVVEHIGEMVGLAAAPGRNVLQDRLGAEIELHDLRHVAVDRLVIGDAGADRIGERDIAGMVGGHQPGHAEGGIGTEVERVEEVVVDAPIDHVDPLGPLGGAHVDELVLDEQVTPLDQLDAELVGQEGMLVIGRVVHAGREQNHGRIAVRRGRGDRFQGRQQLVRIVLDRRDAVAGEQLRKQPQHDLPILQHVGDARRRARVVLQHVEGLGIDPDDVDAAHMHIDVVRHLLAVHLRPEHRVLEHQVLRHDSGLEDLAPSVDVLDVEIDGLDALLEAAPQQVPFGGRENARQHVERDQALLRVGLAVDREGDADAAKQQLGLAPPVIEHIGRNLAQPAGQFAIGGTRGAARLFHLVERHRHGPSPVARPRPTQLPRAFKVLLQTPRQPCGAAQGGGREGSRRQFRPG